jgi:hypothetical protein
VGCVPGRMGIDSIVPVDSLLAPDIYIYIYIICIYICIYRLHIDDLQQNENRILAWARPWH